MDNRRYVTYQNAKVFNWLCLKCISNQLPYHDHSVLSSGTSDACSSSGFFICETFQFDFPPLSSTAGLQVAHLNCCSLLPITGEVYDLVVHNSIDVFAVTETWLDASIEDSEIFHIHFLSTLFVMIVIVMVKMWPFWSLQELSLWLNLICVKVILSQSG